MSTYQTKQGEVVISRTEDDEMVTISADLREGGAWDTNYDARDAIVAAAAPALLKRITLDPEMSCFFAYTANASDASDLVTVIQFVAEEAS